MNLIDTRAHLATLNEPIAAFGHWRGCNPRYVAAIEHIMEVACAACEDAEADVLALKPVHGPNDLPSFKTLLLEASRTGKPVHLSAKDADDLLRAIVNDQAPRIEAANRLQQQKENRLELLTMCGGDADRARNALAFLEELDVPAKETGVPVSVETADTRDSFLDRVINGTLNEASSNAEQDAITVAMSRHCNDFGVSVGDPCRIVSKEPILLTRDADYASNYRAVVDFDVSFAHGVDKVVRVIVDGKHPVAVFAAAHEYKSAYCVSSENTTKCTLVIGEVIVNGHIIKHHLGAASESNDAVTNIDALRTTTAKTHPGLDVVTGLRALQQAGAVLFESSGPFMLSNDEVTALLEYVETLDKEHAALPQQDLATEVNSRPLSPHFIASVHTAIKAGAIVTVNAELVKALANRYRWD